MAKHLDGLKAFDEFRAPWETEGGSDADIDKPKLKRWIYGILTDKAKAQDARDEVKETLTTVEKERDDAKDEAANSNGEEAQKKIDRLEKKVADLTADRDKLVADKEIADLRAEVLEGVDPKHAKHVKGETREELEASLAEIREDFGITESNEGDENDGDEDEVKVRTRPRRVTNPADPAGGKAPDAPIDYEAVADDILGTSVFR